MTRVGQGVDVHRLAAGSGLVLAGVVVPCDLCVLAHSDGDIALHALADAILGAVAGGDIGRYFKDEPKTLGLSSKVILAKSLGVAKNLGYRPCQVDLTLVLERPKIAPLVADMRSSLSTCLDLPIKFISVKATSTDGLGFIGEGKGIACFASAQVAPI